MYWLKQSLKHTLGFAVHTDNAAVPTSDCPWPFRIGSCVGGWSCWYTRQRSHHSPWWTLWWHHGSVATIKPVTNWQLIQAAAQCFVVVGFIPLSQLYFSSNWAPVCGYKLCIIFNALDGALRRQLQTSPEEFEHVCSSEMEKLSCEKSLNYVLAKRYC